MVVTKNLKLRYVHEYSGNEPNIKSYEKTVSHKRKKTFTFKILWIEKIR